MPNRRAPKRAAGKPVAGGVTAVGRVGKSPNPLAPPFRSFGEKLYDTPTWECSGCQDGLTHRPQEDMAETFTASAGEEENGRRGELCSGPFRKKQVKADLPGPALGEKTIRFASETQIPSPAHLGPHPRPARGGAYRDRRGRWAGDVPKTLPAKDALRRKELRARPATRYPVVKKGSDRRRLRPHIEPFLKGQAY